MTVQIGVDPGLTGALCLLHDDGIDIVDMPILDSTVDPYELASILVGWGHVDRIIIERQQTRPGQGAPGTLKTGTNYGIIIGVCGALARPVEYVTPAMWTKALGVGSDKGAHRLRAKQLWPDQADLFRRAKDDGRADAALIAWWAATKRKEQAA